jgi:hypothetical protein
MFGDGEHERIEMWVKTNNNRRQRCGLNGSHHLVLERAKRKAIKKEYP